MARLSLLVLQAMLSAATVNGSPAAAKAPLPVPPKLPMDPALIRPVTVLPEIIRVTANETSSRLLTPFSVAPFVGTLPGVTSEDVHHHGKRIVGPDNRYQYTDRNYPFRTVGKLGWTNGVYCTAFTVGSRTIVTAKHCVPPDNVGAVFYPAIDNNDQPYGNYQITTIITNTHGHDNNCCDWQYDWAVMVVNEKIGDRVGWMGIKTPDPNNVGKPYLYTLGYPGDRDNNGARPFKQDGISVFTKYESNPGYQCDSEPYVPMMSDQDTAGGQSGSPTWEKINNDRYVWGVTSVASSENTGSAAGTLFVQTVIDAKNYYT